MFFEFWRFYVISMWRSSILQDVHGNFMVKTCQNWACRQPNPDSFQQKWWVQALQQKNGPENRGYPPKCQCEFGKIMNQQIVSAITEYSLYLETKSRTRYDHHKLRATPPAADPRACWGGRPVAGVCRSICLFGRNPQNIYLAFLLLASWSGLAAPKPPKGRLRHAQTASC